MLGVHQTGATPVRESYLVEYKQDFPLNRKIARGIAELANTQGGWYIVGVATDNNDVANDISGFSRADHPDPVATVRNIARDAIDPVLLVYPQVIDLDADRAVLVVYVPSGQETPFITSDGTIYRRIHASSDPVPESNRYAVDRLVEQGREVSRRFEQFCQDERVPDPYVHLPQGWVNVFFSPYPLGSIERHDLRSREGIRELIENSRHPIKQPGSFNGQVAFEYGHTTNYSAILRQRTQTYLPTDMTASLTAELFIDGRAKLHIPLRYRSDIDEPGEENLYRAIRSIRVRDAIQLGREREARAFDEGLRFFDLYRLWSDTAAMIQYYFDWLEDDTQGIGLRFALRIDQVWRTVGLMDDDYWGNHAAQYGLPITSVKTIRVPSEAGQALTVINTQEAPAWRTVCNLLGWAFGLPPEVHDPLIEATRQRPFLAY